MAKIERECEGNMWTNPKTHQQIMTLGIQKYLWHLYTSETPKVIPLIYFH